MNQPPDHDWQELAKLWQSGTAPVSVVDIENLNQRQRRRLRAATAAEFIGTALGIVASAWLAFQHRFLWVGVLAAAFAAASAFVVLRARRLPYPPVSGDLMRSLKGSLVYQDWLADQLRYGRALSFVALFAILIAASVQLMHVVTATPSRLFATGAAGAAVVAALVWNMALAWNVRRRTQRLSEFMVQLSVEYAVTTVKEDQENGSVDNH
jgi:hypothetical protein